MANQAILNKRFDGGMSTDLKIGIKNSFANSEGFDFRKSPSQMSVLPGMRRADANVVQDLVQNEVMINSGAIYSIGSAGYIYRSSIGGIYSVFGNVRNGYAGISYREDQNSIYITSNNTVSLISNVTTAPSLSADYYGPSKSTYNNSNTATFNVNANQTGSTKTTAINTSYQEGNATQTRYFQTDIEPLIKIGINIITKGTGDWTVTLHDGLGTQLGVSTVTNANITVGINYFNFPSQVRVSVAPAAQTYHFHVTSTVADGTVSSSSDNDLSTCDMEVWADRLISTNNGLHPMLTFQQFETIGNGRYLSVWEPLGETSPSNAAWMRHKLTFPAGYEVCGTCIFNEYLAIATEATTTGTNTPQSGIIFYWDGLSDTYNYFTKIPEGSPQGINESNNSINYIANGNRYVITSVAATPQKVRRMPDSESTYTSSNTSNKVMPYSATTRNGVQLMAWPSTTTNPNIKMGVYSFGQVDYSFPNSFGYSYALSTGSKNYSPSNNLTIGMVKNFGDTLHVSWRDGTSYGVDVVDNTSKPASFAVWESLVEDMSYVNKEKTALYVTANWLPLDSGASIRLKVKIDRGQWQYSQYFTNTNTYLDGDSSARFDVGEQGVGARFAEVQYGIEVTCDPTVTNPPTIVEISLVADNGSGEVL